MAAAEAKQAMQDMFNFDLGPEQLDDLSALKASLAERIEKFRALENARRGFVAAVAAGDPRVASLALQRQQGRSYQIHWFHQLWAITKYEEQVIALEKDLPVRSVIVRFQPQSPVPTNPYDEPHVRPIIEPLHQVIHRVEGEENKVIMYGTEEQTLAEIHSRLTAQREAHDARLAAYQSVISA